MTVGDWVVVHVTTKDGLHQLLIQKGEHVHMEHVVNHFPLITLQYIVPMTVRLMMRNQMN